MVMGESAEPVDLLVIGGGPGGYTAALRAAELGREVVLVEKEFIGGVCLNVGCIPSKTLIETADAHRTVQRLLPHATDELPDLAVWQDHKAEVVQGLANGVAGLLKKAGVRVLSGAARFTSRSRVAVQQTNDVTTFLEFKQAIIATGSRPVAIPVAPLNGTRVVDSTGALSLETMPKRLVVVGAGYIGIELATAYAKLGSEVTIVELQDRVLPEMPLQFARPVATRLTELGVTVHTSALLTGVDAEGAVCERAGTRLALPADVVLIAVGRRPNTDDLGLEAAWIKTDSGGRIAVGPDRVIPGTGIAAIGDVTEGPMLAHKATAEAVVAAEALCGRKVAFDPAAIPLVVFSDPEVASAGYTEDGAREAGLNVRAVTIPLSALGRAATMGARNGFTQLVVDTEADAVVGVHMAGPHVSELIAEGVLAIEMAASPSDLAATVHAHPTLAEGMFEAASRYVHATR
ncbi:dihydrolipoamide dehydrogenase [Arthrobacter sp. SLBN-100]|uniref:dihydrolipoyl dehydrogenase n=1 Tax=Arthrobacter sp. SLBN-100 TaxID=2768450 RepID=UPI00115437A0|nr:dihydrolipoyl dehydrogenase [Arthrobacter sp. SLBN-100]TQJ62218.1 dihydrolipoamide dehydrogenase [Arthrobacter sp. SLBN-100]